MNDRKKAELYEKYREANNRLILLDYDGTLVDYTRIPATARLTKNLFDILRKLEDSPQTDLFIITGRSHQEIDEIFSNLPIKIIAEHGAMVKERGGWKNQINYTRTWKESVIQCLNQITAKCPDSFIEEKHFSLAWHYRSSEPQIGHLYSRELIGKLEKIIHFHKLKILDGNCVVEIMSEEIGKGEAAKRIIEQNNYDFILSIGDDVTDEEVFENFLNVDIAYTIKVGTGDTYAKFRFTGISDVISLLKHISL